MWSVGTCFGFCPSHGAALRPVRGAAEKTLSGTAIKTGWVFGPPHQDLLCYCLYLIQLQLYACLSSKHVNDDLDHVAVGVNFFHHTDKPVKITVGDFDRVANL